MMNAMNNMEIHTAACGCDTFDQTYSLGYVKGHEDWSPYPRVNHLRQTFLDRPFNIDIERFRNVTESYREHEGEPAVLRCAYAFRSILENAGKICTQIKIDEISNMGAVNIRLRSLFAAVEEQR